MRGQASVEYVAAVTLLALVLAGAGVAVAAPGLPEAVVRELRLALCVVGGDVCGASDAAARGLEPCVVSADEHATQTGVSFLVLRAGGTDFWSVQRRSDGQLTLTTGYGQDLGAGASVGVELGGGTAGGSANASVGFQSGDTWTVSEQQLRVLLKGTEGDPSRVRPVLSFMLGRPSESFLEGGGEAGAELAAEAVREVPGAGAQARAAVGRQKGPDGTTYYLDLGADTSGPIRDVVPGTDLSGRVIAEYRASDPPVITLRTLDRDHAGDEIETVLRLPLRGAADAAAARLLAFADLGDPTAAVRDLVARIRARGTIERFRYRTTTDESGWAYALGLGIELGADRATTSLRRELVEAEVLDGPLPATREDCLGTVATG
ncbi:MAG: hypothetical protein WKF94_13430 [Solirubrobacteraceae bacterium]